MPKPVYEEEDVTMLRNQAVRTDREFTANRPDIGPKNRKIGKKGIQRIQNKMFKEDTNKFYSNLGTKNIEARKLPSMAEVQNLLEVTVER